MDLGLEILGAFERGDVKMNIVPDVLSPVNIPTVLSTQKTEPWQLESP